HAAHALEPQLDDRVGLLRPRVRRAHSHREGGREPHEPAPDVPRVERDADPAGDPPVEADHRAASHANLATILVTSVSRATGTSAAAATGVVTGVNVTTHRHVG